jgi:hypothetical protein
MSGETSNFEDEISISDILVKLWRRRVCRGGCSATDARQAGNKELNKTSQP